MFQRLFPTITPVQYTISLTPNLVDFTLIGKEQIVFTIQKPTKSLTFHAYQLKVLEAVLHKDAKKLSTKEISYNEDEKTITFAFDEEIKASELTLDLSFTGELGEKGKGFYRSQYEVNGATKYMAVTQFEEIGARQAFVCIDDPAAKAVFDITLIVDKKLAAISNTKEIKEEVISGGLKQITFESTPKMSTYIVAFVVGELEYEEVISEGVRIRSYTTDGKKELTKFSLGLASQALSFFNDYFGIDYPLSKLDLFAIPDFDAGAMENWGAITFRESILLIDEKKSSSANKQWASLVIAHELAHMWFGNLVTMEWWTHLWLNEGFACYIEYLCINTLFPQWELWKQFSIIEHSEALKLDSLKFTHPIETPITSDQQVKELFDEISYAKGANVIHMLASFLGEDVFRDGLRYYLKQHAYQNAETKDLWKALEAVSHQPVGEIMHHWTQKPGYPILKVVEGPHALQVTQSRFFANPLSVSDDKILWNIPMRLITNAKNDSEALLIEKEDTALPRLGLWTKLNFGETALVRTLYSEKLYQILGSPISEKKLQPIDRMGIIRDVFDSTEAGLLSSSQALEILKYYKNEDDYIVWSTIAGQLGSLENIISHMDGLSEKFRAYALEIFTPIAKKMEWEKKKGESHTDILLRSMAIHAAGKYGNEGIVEKARSLFKEFITEGIEIDSDIRGVVMAIIAENGGVQEWEKLVSLYENEPLQQEKNRYMLALTQFKSAELIQKTLEYFLTDNVRWQDKSRWVMAVFSNEKGQNQAWNFVKEHWDLFEKEYTGLHGFSRLIEGVGNMVGDDTLNDVKEFFAGHKIEELQRTMNQVVEKIQLNTSWLERDREKIRDFFK